MTERPLISIVIPVYNEAANIPALYERIHDVADGLIDDYRFEFLFTDNHSTDDTFTIISDLATTDDRVRCLRFSRNFGFQRSILTGYLNARGDAAVQIDADLQDPPELIPQFLELWEQGHAVVYGIRSKRPEGRSMTAARSAFYRLVNLVSADDLPHDAGDFRLVDRRILDALRQIDDYHPYLRGLIASFGFDQIGVEYERDARSEGNSKFSFWKLVGLAMAVFCCTQCYRSGSRRCSHSLCRSSCSSASASTCLRGWSSTSPGPLGLRRSPSSR